MRGLRLAVFSLVLASGCTQRVSEPDTSPAAEHTAALSFSPDFELIPTATRVGDPTGNAHNAAVAGLGPNVLAVWEDERFVAQQALIVGGFMTGTLGSNAQMSRFVLAPDNVAQAKPKLAAGSGQFLVVFQSQGDIRGVWVSGSTGLAGPVFSIASTPSLEGNPQVAIAVGTSPVVFAVLWQDTESAGPLRAALYREGQTTPFSGPSLVADGVTAEEDPTLAFNGTNFVTAWKDSRLASPDIFATTFSPTALPGSASAGTAVLSPNSSRVAPRLISGPSGQALLLFFNVTVQRATRLSGVTAVDSPGLQPFPNNGVPSGYFDDGAGRWQLFLESSPNIDGRTVSTAGAVATFPSGLNPVAGPSITGLVAGRYLNGTQNYPIVMYEQAGAVRGVRLFSGQTAEPQFSAAQETQFLPAAATFASGSEAAVVWTHQALFPDDAGTGLDLGWRVVRADGGHSAPVLRALPGTAATPAVAAVGQRALVLSSDLGGRFGSTLSASLFDSAAPSTVTSFPVTVAGGLSSPDLSVGALTGRFLLMWGSASPASVDFTTVLPTATGTDGGFRTAALGGTSAPVRSVAFGAAPGSGGLVATFSGTLPGPVEVRAARVFDDAGFGAGFQLGTAGYSDNTGRPLAVDFDGTNFVVAWVDTRLAGTTPDVFGARVSLAGAVLDPSGVPLEVGPARARDVALSFDGRHHVLATTFDLADGGTDVAVRFLRSDLSALYDAGVTTAEPERQVALAPLGNGATLMAFTRAKYDPAILANRLVATIVRDGLGDGCASNADCHSGFCSGGVCCNTACTGACETCLAAEGASANGTCGPRPGTFTCRAAAAGGCDVAETCDGTGSACPADAFAPPTQVCRPADMGGCDLAERCTGTSAACPTDRIADAGTVCSSPTAPCATDSVCNGTNTTCPVASGVKGAGASCRPAAGVCDVEEKCDGLSQACPPDLLLGTNEVCRPSLGLCDVADHCTGAAPECPGDVVISDNRVCRTAAGLCDAPELCNGTSGACPADVLKPVDTQCREATGVCDVVEKCDGTSADCPVDAVAARDTACRSAKNSCDVPEVCDGVARSCPDDALARDGEMCTSPDQGTCSAGVCQQGNGRLPSQYSFGCSSSPASLSLLALAAVGLAALGRRRRGLALVVLLAGTAAQADEKRLKVVWVGVHATSGVSEQAAQSISDNVQTELSTIQQFQVVSQADLAAVLGVERQKQLLGCSDEGNSCLMEIAGALNADRLVRGDVSRLDETIVLNLSLVDLSNGRQVSRVGRQVDGGLSKLLKETHELILELAGQDPRWPARRSSR
ncbi:MAG: hypothetical protein IPJ65_07810 [Archangiaceae bacterium]|nr:hypothetical protein [Archangiaceae bacterium]